MSNLPDRAPRVNSGGASTVVPVLDRHGRPTRYTYHPRWAPIAVDQSTVEACRVIPDGAHLTAALVLSQILYWLSDPGRHGEPVAVPVCSMSRWMGLSRYAVGRALRHLEEAGLITTVTHHSGTTLADSSLQRPEKRDGKVYMVHGWIRDAISQTDLDERQRALAQLLMAQVVYRQSYRRDFKLDISALARTLGIKRERVRRCVEGLVESGLVERIRIDVSDHDSPESYSNDIVAGLRLNVLVGKSGE